MTTGPRPGRSASSARDASARDSGARDSGARDSGALDTGARQTRAALVVGLTVLTGITDVVAFLRLDGVFTSVMTGNMVLFGLALIDEDAVRLEQTGLAVACYFAGSVMGGWLAGTAQESDSLWPRTVTVTLLVEASVFSCFSVIWWATGAGGTAAARPVTLALCAAALGLQSSAVLRLGVPGLSTTYLTGTLTGVAQSLSQRTTLRTSRRAVLTLLGLVTGALIGGALCLQAPLLVPVALLATLCGAIVLGRRLHLDGVRPSR